jgi:hypothetical protein
LGPYCLFWPSKGVCKKCFEKNRVWCSASVDYCGARWRPCGVQPGGGGILTEFPCGLRKWSNTPQPVKDWRGGSKSAARKTATVPFFVVFLVFFRAFWGPWGSLRACLGHPMGRPGLRSDFGRFLGLFWETLGRPWETRGGPGVPKITCRCRPGGLWRTPRWPKDGQGS